MNKQIEGYLHALYKNTISNIELIRNMSETFNMLDSQEYLNFLDKLNELSLDQDRK